MGSSTVAGAAAAWSLTWELHARQGSSVGSWHDGLDLFNSIYQSQSSFVNGQMARFNSQNLHFMVECLHHPHLVPWPLRGGSNQKNHPAQLHPDGLLESQPLPDAKQSEMLQRFPDCNPASDLLDQLHQKQALLLELQ